jgi:hypothetical protein
VGARPEPFREGEVAAWWDPDRALVRLLAVNMADGLFEGEFVDRPGEIFTQDLDNICHRTPAYERWSTALQERFAAHGVSESTETAEARQRAWQETINEERDLWLAVKGEHPILGIE